MAKREYVLEEYRLLDNLENDVIGLIENCHIQLENTDPDSPDFVIKGQIKGFRHVLTLIENLKKGE